MRILHKWIIHPTSPCMSFLPALQPSYFSILQNVPNTEHGLHGVVLTQRHCWHWHWHWHSVPHAHSEWLCPHASMPPGPPAQQDTDSWQWDTRFCLHCYKGHSLAFWSWLCGQRWVREASRHSSRRGFGGLGAAPTESLNSLAWEGPSADPAVPTPLKAGTPSTSPSSRPGCSRP